MFRKRNVNVPDDLNESQEARARAQAELDHLQRTTPHVESLTARLNQRRQENHFGEQLTISFTRRGTT